MALFLALASADHTVGQGAFRTSGSGCLGSNQRVPAVRAFESPDVGSTFELGLTDGAPGTPAFAFLGAAGISVPLTALGAPGCTLQVAGSAVGTMTDAAGDARIPLVVPNLPSLVGASVRGQWAVADQAANALGFVLSNTGIATFELPGPMPVAVAAELQRGPSNTAVLQATFPSARGLSGFSFQPDVQLQRDFFRDDGRDVDPIADDGVFHARVGASFTFEQQQFLVRQQLIARRPRIPEFVGRRLARLITPNQLPQPGIGFFPLLTVGVGTPIDPERSLMIRSPGVVEDPGRTWNPCTGVGNPNGAWTFKHLMTEMCNQPLTGIDPRDFVFTWMNSFTVPQSVNGFVVPPRPGAAGFLASWPRDGAGKLDLDRAPFKLIAIVNRVDLRKGSFYGGGDAGEGRLVFCAVDCSGGIAEQFTVIFEYKVPISGCFAVKAWGQQWADLSSIPIGSPAYNAALEAITRRFTDRNAAPSSPNGSALGQLRTNEIEFGPLWELREFRILSPTLRTTTVAQTPDFGFDNSASLRDFLVAEAESPEIPLLFMGTTPLRGGSAPTPGGFFWKFPGAALSTDKRHAFSLNTCNGCHAGETATSFTHVRPAFFGATAALSRFLVGDPGNSPTFTHDVVDPDGSGVTRGFNDLERRKEDLDVLISSSCFLDVLRLSIFEHRFMRH